MCKLISDWFFNLKVCSRNELPLIDYIQTVGNFQSKYISSGFYSSGYYDMWNCDTTDLTGNEESLKLITTNRASLLQSTGDTVLYDFLFRPPAGILNSIKPLAPKFEVVISFDSRVRNPRRTIKL